MKCDRKDCENEAEYYPQLILRPKGYEDCDPAKMVLKLAICPTCRFKVKKEEFTKGEGWDFLMKLFDTSGMMRPHPKATKIKFIKIEEADKIFAKDPRNHNMIH